MDSKGIRVEEASAVEGQLNDKSQELAKIALELPHTHTRAECRARAMGTTHQMVETATQVCRWCSALSASKLGIVLRFSEADVSLRSFDLRQTS